MSTERLDLFREASQSLGDVQPLRPGERGSGVAPDGFCDPATRDYPEPAEVLVGRLDGRHQKGVRK